MSTQEDSFSVLINQSTQVEFFFFLMPWHSTEAIIDVCVRTLYSGIGWGCLFQKLASVAMALGRRRKTASEMASLSWLRPVWRPRTGFGGNHRWPKPRSVDRLLHTVSKQRKSKCLQSQAEARQVWSREAKSLWSQQDSICPAARQLLAGDTYLAVKAEHFRQAELFCFVRYRDLFIINNIIFTM